MISLLHRRELESRNRKYLKYPLAAAEKDYLLAVVSKIIYDSPLRNKLVFKGGTAIHHCYLEQTRFSEDLDFTSLDNSINLREIKNVLKSQDFLEIKKEYVSAATIKIERLKYNGPLGLPNSLKIEIDFLQNVVLPARDIEYRNPWGVKGKARVMDVREICAEKIRTASDRARYRDFYDLALLFANYNFNFTEIFKLIAQKEIRKAVTQESIASNWEIAKEGKKAEQIYFAKDVDNAVIEKLIEKLKINIG